MIDTRVFYKKLGDIRYISHLDMNRLMQRALARSRLPVWYTQGFNPHMYITFALPLSLGFESDYEIMDIRLNTPVDSGEIAARLGAQMPAGLDVFRAAPPEYDISHIAWSVFDIRLAGSIPEVEELFGGAIPVKKKSKRGVVEIDVRPFTELAELREEAPRTVHMTLRCASGTDMNVNPSLIVGAYCARYGGEESGASYRRTAVLMADGQAFR